MSKRHLSDLFPREEILNYSSRTGSFCPDRARYAIKELGKRLLVSYHPDRLKDIEGEPGSLSKIVTSEVDYVQELPGAELEGYIRGGMTIPLEDYSRLLGLYEQREREVNNLKEELSQYRPQSTYEISDNSIAEESLEERVKGSRKEKAEEPSLLALVMFIALLYMSFSDGCAMKKDTKPAKTKNQITQKK